MISTYCRLKNKRNIDRYSLTGFVNIHVNQMNFIDIAKSPLQNKICFFLNGMSLS